MNDNEIVGFADEIKAADEIVTDEKAEELARQVINNASDIIEQVEKLDLEKSNVTETYDADIISGEIPRIARFEKVSFEEFMRAYKPIWIEAQRIAQEVPEGESFGYSVEDLNNDCKIIYENIQLPKRATSGSAGYDFFFPYGSAEIPAGATVFIPTGIKVHMASNWVLLEAPRSGMGMKYRIQLDNTIGVVDSDYYNNEENEGHIFIKLTNDSRDGSTCVIEHQSRFCQGIFVPYGITVDDNVTDTREGGLGSTGA